MTASKAASRLARAASVADLVSAEQEAAGAAARSGSRVVGGRTFRQEAGAWVDVAHTAQMLVVHVEPFSKAYFDVLARLPELKAYWTTFDVVTVAGRQTSIKLAPGGRATLTASELEALVRGFRVP